MRGIGVLGLHMRVLIVLHESHESSFYSMRKRFLGLRFGMSDYRVQQGFRT